MILYVFRSLPFTFNDDADPIITIYRVQQFIYILCIIYILLFTSEPTPEDLMRDTARRLQQVTDLILENISDVNATVRQMFQDPIDQQLTRLMEHQDGGSMRARRKSCKKRGRKSNRKKLNRKTSRKV